MRFHLTRVSSNAKVGPIPTVVISNDSCPDVCAYKNNGCYAELGPIGMHWNKVNSGERGVEFHEFLKQISSLPNQQLWRYGVAGDLPGKGDVIDAKMLKRLVDANANKRGFTYTHKPISNENNKLLIAFANLTGFTINLSSNNMIHADELLAARPEVTMEMSNRTLRTFVTPNWPVVTILPHDFGDPIEHKDAITGKVTKARIWKWCTTPAGNRVVQCPAEYRKEVQCANCGGGSPLCHRTDRNFIVGFTAHGVQKKRATEVAKQGLPIIAA